MFTEIRVALVYQQESGIQGLQTALANAGVDVVVTCRASELDADGITNSRVDAIVVNLDPELEDLLDQVTDALDSVSQPVIYNDPAASSDLSGWDRARWLRHLSAKMKGKSDVTPPAPPGAQAIPIPVAKIPPTKVAAPPVVDAFVMLAVAPSADPGLAAVSAPAVAVDMAIGDFDLSFDEPAAATSHAVAEVSVAEPMLLDDLESMFAEPPTSPGTAAAMTPVESIEIDDLDLMFEAPAPKVAEPAPPVAAVEAVTVGDDLGDLDALFSNVAIDAEPSAPPARPAEASELDLDTLFSEAPRAHQAADSVAPQVNAAELTDLDALFREFEASQASQASTKSTPSAPVAAASSTAATPKAYDFSELSLSLEPVEEEKKSAAGPVDRMVAEWRLDAPSKPIGAATPKPVAAAPVAKQASGPAIPAGLEASLAKSGLRLLDETEVDNANAAGTGSSRPAEPDLSAFGDLGSLELSSLDLDSPTLADAAQSIDLESDLGLANLDFDLDFGSADEGHSAIIAGANDTSLGDLDSLFEPLPEAAPLGLSLPDLDRVYVLGASIGGPEAIKAFLARLPAAVPAAFLIAQHMGGEFLEMMATQLNAASPLAVRFPKAGERLRHGEVVVAPANEQLSIDATGHLQLNAASSGSPFNPSIDHLVRAVADRFGDHATLILFSGMGTDAVEGGRYLTARGGQVWAQERSSCVIASMIDSAKSQGLIRFEGTPAQLAERVLQVVS